MTPSDGDMTHPSNYPAPTQTTSSVPESTILPDSKNGIVGNWEASLGSNIPQYWSDIDSMGFPYPAPADWLPTPWSYSLSLVLGQQGEYVSHGPEGDAASVNVNPNDSPRSPVSPPGPSNHKNEFLLVEDAIAHVSGGQNTDYPHSWMPSIGSTSYLCPEQETPVSVQHRQRPTDTEPYGTDDGLGHQAMQHGYNVGLGIHHIGIPQQYAECWSQPEPQPAYPYFSPTTHDDQVDVDNDDDHPEQETQASAQADDDSDWTWAAYSSSDDCDEVAEGWHLINKK